MGQKRTYLSRPRKSLYKKRGGFVFHFKTAIERILYYIAVKATVLHSLHDVSNRVAQDSYHKERADNCDFTHGYRLCVLASGSLITDVFNCRTLIKISCLHFGQNNGKFSSIVSSRIFNRVLFLQTGHNIHLISAILSPLSKFYNSYLRNKSNLKEPLIKGHKSLLTRIKTQWKSTSSIKWLSVPSNAQQISPGQFHIPMLQMVCRPGKSCRLEKRLGTCIR